MRRNVEDESVRFLLQYPEQRDKLLRHVPQREAEWLSLHYGVGREHAHTLKEIAEMYAYASPGSVRRGISRALTRLWLLREWGQLEDLMEAR